MFRFIAPTTLRQKKLFLNINLVASRHVISENANFSQVKWKADMLMKMQNFEIEDNISMRKTLKMVTSWQSCRYSSLRVTFS